MPGIETRVFVPRFPTETPAALPPTLALMPLLLRFSLTGPTFLLFLNLIAGLCVLGVGAISGYAFSAFSGKHKKIAKDVQFNIETCNTKIEELKKEKSSLIKEQEIELAEYKEFILYGKQPVISNNNKQKTQIQEQYKNDNDLSM